MPPAEGLRYQTFMASKTTLNAKNLEALGAKRLAELLIEVITAVAAMKRGLRLELAGERGRRKWRVRSGSGLRPSPI